MRRSSDIPGGRPRKDLERAALLSPIPLGHNAPTSFRMAREEDLESTSINSSKVRSNSTFGVQSLQDTMYEAPSLPNRDKDGENDDGNADPHGGRRRSTLRPIPQPRTRNSSRGSVEEAPPNTTNSSSSRPNQEGPSPPSMSHSLTSLSLDSQAPLSSVPSTPKSTSNRSFHHSDEGSMDDGSQAIVSSEDDKAEPQSEIQDSAPQLIMPSIKMPSRRPFTERGKAMGRLKVLIAGDSGVGKTSLIKSIVQLCEDIVHVDPLSPNLPSVETLLSRKPKSKPNSLNVKATQHITEVYASTKAYPSWWSDIEDTKVLRRRKSMGDTVLERNLCFVDTPGYSNGISRMESIQSVLQYIEAQLTKPFSAPTASEGDIAGLLSGSGGTQVDVVFYLVAQGLKEEDVTFLQRLAAITNVIPLIAKADKQSHEGAEMLRRSIDKLRHAEISLFTFNSGSPASAPPYTVCSAPAEDNDTMDASTLMSPDYVQPLVPSELAILVQQVFDPDSIACLRHLAAKKLVHAQGSRIFSMPAASQRSASIPLHDRPTASPTSPTSSPNTSRTIVSYNGRMSPYIQARISDHTLQEEKLAQLRLAKWAGDLQRSLQNERARYEAIARGERAVWLTQRLDETVNDGALVSVRESALIAQTDKENLPTKGEVGRIAGHCGLLDAGDPLGLLRWNEAMKRRGWIAFQVMGGFGILGAMAMWMARTWGAGSDGYGTWPWGWMGNRA